MYTENMLAKIARRENNNKRNYLVVDPLQGKHVPVSPSECLKMFGALADIVRESYSGQRLLLIGFAETATAIGAALAVELGAMYTQTTREDIDGADYLFFTESHSHATEQRLVSNDLADMIAAADRIIFVEDEITTGNTMLKIINIIRRKYGSEIKFSAASLLNGMDGESLERYKQGNIAVHYLVKTEHSGYGAIADGYSENGEYVGCNTAPSDFRLITAVGRMDTRRLVNGEDYGAACAELYAVVRKNADIQGKTVLVVGTEEFMYPAIYIAAALEKEGFEVRTHSTTRSPIAVSRDEGYPLRRRFELRSLYDPERTTYIYDIARYDSVVVVTDAQKIAENGLDSLVNALKSAGNENINIINWRDE